MGRQPSPDLEDVDIVLQALKRLRNRRNSEKESQAVEMARLQDSIAAMQKSLAEKEQAERAEHLHCREEYKKLEMKLEASETMSALARANAEKYLRSYQSADAELRRNVTPSAERDRHVERMQKDLGGDAEHDPKPARNERDGQVHKDQSDCG